jgi:hypothetical protein
MTRRTPRFWRHNVRVVPVRAETVVERPHDRIPGDDYHEWIVHTHRTRRDSTGRRIGRGYGPPNYLTMVCNNPSCRAMVAVAVSTLHSVADDAVAVFRRGGVS